MSFESRFHRCETAISKFKSNYALVAQLDRAFVYGTKGLGFESPRVHQIKIACALLTTKSAFFIYNFFNLSKQKIGGNYDQIKILELGTRGQKR